jgi:hypothetical protein
LPPQPEADLPPEPGNLPPTPGADLPPEPGTHTVRETGPYDHESGQALLDALAGHLPEFVPAYLALAEACDDDPGEPVVFAELADFVAARLALLETGRPVLERALGIIEAHLDAAEDIDEAADLIGLAFFDCFSPEDRRRLVPWLGPRSLATLESLDAPGDVSL